MSTEDTGSYLDNAGTEPGTRPGASAFSRDTRAMSGSTHDTSEMSVVGPTLVIKGELEAGEDLLVQGRVEGTITHNAQSLIIGEQGTVHADIKGHNVVIEGVVEGDIYGSESVSIRETAQVKGNVFTPRISITEGAHFKGGIDMDVAAAGGKTH